MRAVACACALMSALLVGCASRQPSPPPPPALRAARPADAIPADLDVALRIDLVGARRALGPDISRQIELGVADPKEDPVASSMLASVLERADTIWIAFRPGHSASSTDNVVIARGRFEDIDPKSFQGSKTWGAPTDLGGDVRRYERSKPGRRSAPARVYMLGTSLVMFVSEAEIDSVERAVELRAGDKHVDPPDRGTLSLAARMPPVMSLIGERFPAVADVLSYATELSGWVATGQTGMQIELEIQFVGAEEARAAAAAAEILRKELATRAGPWALVAKAVKTEAVGPNLVLHGHFGPDRVGQLVACFAYGSDCDD